MLDELLVVYFKLLQTVTVCVEMTWVNIVGLHDNRCTEREEWDVAGTAPTQVTHHGHAQLWEQGAQERDHTAQRREPEVEGGCYF